MKNKLLFGLFIFAIALSCVVNLYTLNKQSIRLDESQSLWVAPKTIPGIISYIAKDVHLPLYHILLHFWIAMFGNTILTARSLSFVFFFLTIPMLYILAKESSNSRVAMLTVTLFVLSPFVMWYSNETRMYSLFTFATTANHLYFLRLIRSRGEKGRIGYVLSAVLGVYSHYFFNMMLGIQWMFVIGKVILESRQKKITIKDSVKNNNSILTVFSSLTFIAWLALSPWLLYVNAQGGTKNMQPLIEAPTSYNLFTTFVNFIFGFQSQQIQAVIIALWPITTIFLFFLFTRRQSIVTASIRYFIVVSTLPIIITFLASYFRPIFLSRYLIMVTPTLFFVLSVALVSMNRKVSRVLIPTLIILLAGLSLYQNSSAQTPVREDFTQVAQYLGERVTERDIVVVSAPFTVYPIEYTYNGRARITTIPEWSRYEAGPIPPFSKQELQKQVDALKKQYEKIYVVLAYDQGYEKDIEDYLDNNFERLDMKEFSPGLQVRTYRFRYDIENLFKKWEENQQSTSAATPSTAKPSPSPVITAKPTVTPRPTTSPKPAPSQLSQPTNAPLSVLRL